MHKELSLQEIKAITFDILKHFNTFCQENSLSFYLSNGTLLGAVKYGGFIPWDDDIDVLMPRKDYEKFISLFKDSDKFALYTYERNKKYKFPYAKLCAQKTLKVETNIDSGIDLGVDIDIFPLDTCSVHIFNNYIQKKLAIYQRGCFLSKFISTKDKSIFKQLIIRLCKLMGYEFFYKRLKNIVKQETIAGGEYMGCLMWPIYGKKEIIPRNVFQDTIEIEFEGEKFPAPIGYDSYLRSLYGSYEKDPPIEKQKTHHSYTAYSVF